MNIQSECHYPKGSPDQIVGDTRLSPATRLNSLREKNDNYIINSLPNDDIIMTSWDNPYRLSLYEHLVVFS